MAAIKGIIFDVDGVLLDSMPVWHTVSWYMLKDMGIEADPDIGNEMFAMRIGDAAEWLIQTFDLTLTPEEIIDRIDRRIEDAYRTTVLPKDGAGELLARLEALGIPMVIGTSTDRSCIEAALARLDFGRYFRRIFTCTEVGKPKSEPDLFLAAMEELGTRPEETLLIEDGLYSVRTAKVLGIRTVGVYDYTSRADQKALEETADHYLPEGVSLNKIEGFLAPEGAGKR